MDGTMMPLVRHQALKWASGGRATMSTEPMSLDHFLKIGFSYVFKMWRV